MIDVNNPEIQKYVEEELQKQREEIAERILWRNAGAPYLGPSMEEIEYYTGLSLDQLAKIEKKCKWKLQYREGYREGWLLAGVRIWRNFLDKLNNGDFSDRVSNDSFIETMAKDCGIIDPKDSDLTTWRENPVKCAVMELVSQGIGDADIMRKLELTSDQFKKLYPTWKEQIAYHSVFSCELPSEEELEAEYQEMSMKKSEEYMYEHSCPYEDADDDIKAEADACMRRIKKRKEAEKNDERIDN